MRTRLAVIASLATAAAFAAAQPALAAPASLREANGDSATVTTARDNFRTDLGGGTTAGANGLFGGVRREINWDAVPAASRDPFSGDFFKVRGVRFTTPGTKFVVSGSAADPAPTSFSDINPTYLATFAPFSPDRLFSAIGSTITDVNFVVPGTDTPATTQGFGAVFADVDSRGPTKIDYFNSSGTLIASRSAPGAAGQLQFSFLGFTFGCREVARVRITSGAAPLGASPGGDDATLGGSDVTVMDDFVYGEPSTATPICPPGSGQTGGFTSRASDVTNPVVRIKAKRAEDIDHVYVDARADETVTFTGAATVNVPRLASRNFKFKGARRKAGANKRVRLRFRLSKRRKRAAKRALHRGRRLRAGVKIVARDAAGNATTKRVRIRLTDRRKRRSRRR